MRSNDFSQILTKLNTNYLFVCLILEDNIPFMQMEKKMNYHGNKMGKGGIKNTFLHY